MTICHARVLGRNIRATNGSHPLRTREHAAPCRLTASRWRAASSAFFALRTLADISSPYLLHSPQRQELGNILPSGPTPSCDWPKSA